MRWLIVLILLFCNGFTAALATDETAKVNIIKPEWTIGEEREVINGRYARFVNEQSGWRYWRFETRQGVVCNAVKALDGGNYLSPSGLGEGMKGAYPYISISGYKKSFNTYFFGSGTGGDVKYRKPNDRFWVEYSPVLVWDFTILDSQKLEVSVISWEYPNLQVNGRHEQGFIDLTGHNIARQWVKDCVKQK